VTYLIIIAVAWLAATACGWIACRAQFRQSPKVQAWNLTAALAYMTVALTAALEGDWTGAGIASFVALLRWLLWGLGRRVMRRW
jgi:hypothetical protein